MATQKKQTSTTSTNQNNRSAAGQRRSQGKDTGVGKKLAVVGALAAAAASAYYLYGPDGKQNRKSMKTWMNSMQKEVAQKARKAKALNKKVYEDIVDEVSKGYERVRNVDMKELKELSSDLKKHWTAISKNLSSAGNEVKTRTVKAVSKKPGKTGTKNTGAK